MANSENQKTGGAGVQRLSLSSVKGARRTLARLVQDFYNSRIDADRFRLTVYGISNMVQFFKIENEMDVERRISALEEKILSSLGGKSEKH